MGKAKLRWSEEGIQLDSLEGAGNVVHLLGPPISRLAHLAMHRVDLQFAEECLTVIETAPMAQWHTAPLEACWRSALLHYCKCFAGQQGGVGRTQLNARKILGPQSGQRMRDHRLMMEMRNKHLVHDEGTHNWWDVVAAIAPVGNTPAVLGIQLAAMDSVTLDDLTVPTLRALVNTVHAWTVAEFEQASADVGATIDASYSHSELLQKKVLGVAYNSKAKR